MSKRIRLALTVRNDADLLWIRSIEEFDFKAWIKDSLRSYASSGQTVKTMLSGATTAKMKLMNVMLSVTLHERRDASTIEWLGRLKENCRATAIKNVLRCSLVNPCLNAYYNDFTNDSLKMQLEGEKNIAGLVGRMESIGKQPTVTDAFSQPSHANPPEEITMPEECDIFSLNCEID